MDTVSLQMTGYLDLFWQAGIVVKAVMIGLLAASLASWAVIFEKSIALMAQSWRDRRFIARYRAGEATPPTPCVAAELLARMQGEAARNGWSGLGRQCADGQFRLVIARALRRRRAGLPFLATVASAAPFVGLFGTVWGIMTSFTSIAESQNTSLAVVAPGIAEALLATAVGLFAAIPAAIFFNRLTTRVNASVGVLDEFGQEVMIDLTREAMSREGART